MGIFKRAKSASRLEFAGVSSRALDGLASMDVSGDPSVESALRSVGISTDDSDARFRSYLAACLLHPAWDGAWDSLSSQLLDLAISPDDDYREPEELIGETIAPLFDLAERYTGSAEQGYGAIHAVRAAQVLAMLSMFKYHASLVEARLPEQTELLRRCGAHLSEADLNQMGRSAAEMVRPYVS